MFPRGLPLLQQQSILCRLFSAAKWGVKDAEAGTWWIMARMAPPVQKLDKPRKKEQVGQTQVYKGEGL